MQEDSTRKRTHKPLLLAAIGVATVSFVGAQGGCAASTDQNDDDAPYDDEEEQADAPVGSAQQALSQQALSQQALSQPALTEHLTTDILVRDRNLELARWRWPIPVGNLMVVPIDRLDVTIQQQLAHQAIVK